MVEGIKGIKGIKVNMMAKAISINIKGNNMGKAIMDLLKELRSELLHAVKQIETQALKKLRKRCNIDDLLF